MGVVWVSRDYPCSSLLSLFLFLFGNAVRDGAIKSGSHAHATGGSRAPPVFSHLSSLPALTLSPTRPPITRPKSVRPGLGTNPVHDTGKSLRLVRTDRYLHHMPNAQRLPRQLPEVPHQWRNLLVNTQHARAGQEQNKHRRRSRRDPLHDSIQPGELRGTDKP